MADLTLEQRITHLENRVKNHHKALTIVADYIGSIQRGAAAILKRHERCVEAGVPYPGEPDSQG